MTPITIEPNSGVKMAGVKIITTNMLATKDLPEEIVFLSCWLLYEEPTPEVKAKIANSVYSFDGGKTWRHHGIMNYEDAEETRLSSEREGIKFIWPAKFDMDGFLIIPEEFK